MVCRSRGERVPPAAQAYVPTRAVALVVSVRAPGLARRIFTCRTRAPPFPTWSAGATDSTVPVRVSRVPDRVTWAVWPAEMWAASPAWKGTVRVMVEVSVMSATAVPAETRSPSWTWRVWTTPPPMAFTWRLLARVS